MPSAGEIRNGLKGAKRKREAADALHAKGTAELRRWLRAAQKHPDLSMEEAARLGGFKHRESALRLLKGSKG